jgi:hypothetical protein
MLDFLKKIWTPPIKRMWHSWKQKYKIRPIMISLTCHKEGVKAAQNSKQVTGKNWPNKFHLHSVNCKIYIEIFFLVLGIFMVYC